MGTSHQYQDSDFTPHSTQHGAGEQDLSFEPFSPQEAASTKPMDIIHNLPNPNECEFDHQYIAQHLTQLQMDPTLCSKCSPATKYFCSPEPVIQELYKKSCYWKQVPESTLSMDMEPYKNLQTPYYNAENIGIQHPPNRPRGQVHIKRVFKPPQGNKEFAYTAKMSSLSALRTLKDKPAMAKEVTHKLRADVNNGVLIKLSDFLKLPEVIEAGITMENAKEFICPAPLHLVANANSIVDICSEFVGDFFCHGWFIL